MQEEQGQVLSQLWFQTAFQGHHSRALVKPCLDVGPVITQIFLNKSLN